MTAPMVEVTELGRLEAVIERGLTTFVEVGNALLEIRERRLYRETHGTFEGYCRERWGWSRVHAHRHIQAAQVAGVLPIGNAPQSEAVARELAPLLDQPEAVAEVWHEAQAAFGPTPTAAEVRDVVEAKFNHRAQGTGDNEWYTPPAYLDLAREVLGGFDVDPASSAVAQQTVQAATYFTISDNGLDRPWHGTVWLNPPYTQPEITRFTEKLVHEVRAGRCTGAILLTHNYTDTGWFHHAAEHCQALCFTRGRIRFVNPAGDLASPTQGQAFFYFGPDVDRFRSCFTSVGFVR